MKTAATTPRFRGPILALLAFTALARVNGLVNNLGSFPAYYRFFVQDLLTQEATFWRGIYYIYETVVPSLLAFITLLFFLVYILKFCRNGKGKALMLAVYGITMLDLFMDVIWLLVLPGESGIVTLSSVTTCLLLLLFGYATVSYGMGSERKLPLLLGPAAGLLYGLYLLFFVSIPSIPTALANGISPVTLILSYIFSLCSYCWFAALILFALGQDSPEQAQ